jgi:putative FmdB family regulatory protein
VPRYDYRCRTCDTTFEVRRALTEPETCAPCPEGHPETSRVFSAVAVGGGSAAPATSGAGGCCGGGCCG